MSRISKVVLKGRHEGRSPLAVVVEDGKQNLAAFSIVCRQGNDVVYCRIGTFHDGFFRYEPISPKMFVPL